VLFRVKEEQPALAQRLEVQELVGLEKGLLEVVEILASGRRPGVWEQLEVKWRLEVAEIWEWERWPGVLEVLQARE
jgi:hypothetical protein